MILVTALSLTDARLYEAADALGTRTAAPFWTITLPGAKYGLISAAMVVFTYALSDFGIPKVIGGNFNMLATDIFKLVIGQQDFAKGAVVAIILLAPVAVTYVVDAWVQQAAVGAALGALGALRPEALARLRLGDGGLLLGDGAPDARRPRHGRVRLLREALAVQLLALARPTTAWGWWRPASSPPT